MWPLEAPPPGDPAQRAQAICDQLLAETPTPPAWPDPARSLAPLEDIAGAVHGQPERAQRQQVTAAAARHGVDPTVAFDLAGGVGALIAQTAHRKGPDVPGLSRLNILAGVHLGGALALFLARDRIRHAQAHSDPDLPRLWMLANGLTHGVTVAVMRAVPARSVGSAARLVPLHDDLLDWRGMCVAIEHMTATVTALVEGHHWLDRTPQLAGADDKAVALGLVALAQPTLALTLARHGVTPMTTERARLAVGPVPAGVLDLSDQVLKGMCDCNGWLLGAASERTQRELVQRSRRAPAASPSRPSPRGC